MSFIYYLRNVPVTRQTQSQTEFTEPEGTPCETSERCTREQKEMLLDQNLRDSSTELSSDPTCDESELLNSTAEEGNNQEHEGSFSKDPGPSKDPNILTNFNVGLEIAKSTQGIRISFDVSQSSIEKAFSSLLTSIMPTLQQQKEKLESNCEVRCSKDERNQTEVENSEEIETCVERECEKAKQGIPERIADYQSQTAALNRVDYHAENIDVSIQTDKVRIHSPPSLFFSPFSIPKADDLSNTAVSADTQSNMHDNGKSIASVDLNQRLGSTDEMQLNESENLSLDLNESEKRCINDITTEKSISIISTEDLDAVRVEEKEHSELRNNIQHESEKLEKKKLIIYSACDEENLSLHDSDKIVKVDTDCNSDGKSMSKEVAFKKPIHFDGDRNCSVEEYLSPNEEEFSESEEKDYSFKNDSLTSKCSEKFLEQSMSKKYTKKASITKDILNTAVCELEVVASKVVALSEYLNFKRTQNVTEEPSSSSTSHEKTINTEQNHEFASFQTSCVLIESFDNEKIATDSLPDDSNKEEQFKGSLKDNFPTEESTDTPLSANENKSEEELRNTGTSFDEIPPNTESNRKNSIIDTSRNEFLQNILENSSSPIESDLNVDTLAAYEKEDSIKKIHVDSEICTAHVYEEISTSESLETFSDTPVKNDGMITSEKNLSELQEPESIETKKSMSVPGVHCNKIISNDESCQISNENTPTVPQPNMATNVKTFKDLKMEECWPQPVKDSITRDADICSTSDFLDRDAELKDTCSEKNTYNGSDFSENDANNVLCSENEETILPKSNGAEDETSLNVSSEISNESDEESIDKQKKPNIELVGTTLKDLSENTFSSDKASILDRKDQSLELECTQLNDSHVLEEESVVKQEGITSVELASTDLKGLVEKVLNSDEESQVEKEDIKSMEFADKHLKASEGDFSSEESAVDQEIQSTKNEGAELQAGDEDSLVSEETIEEQRENQNVELVGTCLKVLGKDDPTTEESAIDQEEIQNVKRAELKVLDEGAPVSEKSGLEQEDNQDIEHTGTDLKVRIENVILLEEKSIVEHKIIQNEHISTTEHLAVANLCPNQVDEETVVQNEIKNVCKGDLESTIHNKLLNEIFEGREKNEENSDQDFNQPETNFAASKNIESVQNESAASDPNTELHTGNVELKSQSSVSNNDLQESRTISFSEDVTVNSESEHSYPSQNDYTGNSLNVVNEDGTNSEAVASEHLLNKTIESNFEKGETSELSTSLKQESDINSKKSIIDEISNGAESENIQHTCKDLVKNAIAIFTSPNHPKIGINTSNRKLQEDSMSSPNKTSIAGVSFNSADETTLSLSDTPEVLASECSPNRLNKKIDNESKNDSILEPQSSGKKTDCLQTEEGANALLSCKQTERESLKDHAKMEQSLDESAVMDDSNQVVTSSSETTVTKEDFNITYVTSTGECNKQIKSFDTETNESENASNYKSDSENSVSTHDEIDAAPTRDRTAFKTRISSASVEETGGAENTEAKLHDNRTSKTKNSVRKTADRLDVKRSDRCKSEEPVATSSKSAKPIQARRSSESLVRRISNEFQSKIESVPNPQPTRLSRNKNISLDSNSNTQKTLKKTRSIQEDTVTKKVTRARAIATADSSESDQSEASVGKVSTPTKQRVRTRNTVLSQKTRNSSSLEMVLEEPTTPRRRLRDNVKEGTVPAKSGKAKVADSSESDQSELNAELASTPVKQRARTRNLAISDKMRSSSSLEKVSEESTPTLKRGRDKVTTPVVKQDSAEPGSAGLNPASKRLRARNTNGEPKPSANAKKPSRAGKE